MSNQFVNCAECLKIFDRQHVTTQHVTFRSDHISIFICHSCKRAEHVRSADSYFENVDQAAGGGRSHP
jgi:hypothetical protein